MKTQELIQAVERFLFDDWPHAQERLTRVEEQIIANTWLTRAVAAAMGVALLKLVLGG